MGTSTMKYYWLVAKDQRNNNWLFYHESVVSGIRIREQYASLVCQKCKKFDELKAIELGISPEVSIKSKTDYLSTDDGIDCIKNTAWKALQDAGVTGLRAIELPGDSHYKILLPTARTPTIIEKAQMEFHRRCDSCGRYKETCGFPALEAIELPNDPLQLICPEASMENSRGCMSWFLASQTVVNILRQIKMKGVEFLLAW